MSEEITLNDEERTPCEKWTRVMGYHRPVSAFNVGKQGEFEDRRYYTEQAAGLGAHSTVPGAER